MTSQQDLVARLARREVSRRDFIRRAAALGISASAIAGFLAACGGSSPTATAATSATTSSAAATSKASSSTTASSSAATTSAATTSAATTSAASSTTASASAAAAASPTRASGAATPGTPAAGVGAAAIGAPSTAKPGAAGGIGPGPTKRGAAGTLKVLYWQAATTLNPHFASGAKDQDAARLVLEPLAEFGPNDTLIPWLAAEIPTIANGGIAKDGKSVTWKLKPGIKWSDGQPFTAQDCVFTWQFASTKETGATTIGNYLAVDKVEALDETTVKVSFTAPNPAWYLPLTDAILPEHIFKDAIGKEAKNFAGNLKPIGTGPYKVDDFKPGDSVAYSVNPNWRDPNGPAFDQVQWKGGGDATSAARAVLQTGDYHLAWNLQVEPAIFNQLVKQAGDRAKIGYQPGSGVERVVFNFTDPNKTDPDTGERSSVKFPHPFLTDKTVRQALNLVADRKAIADTLYGPAGEPWALIQNAPESALPQDATWAFDLEKAGQLLDQAGWKKNGQYRAKDGVQMKLLFQTTTNSVRQKTQQILKDALEKLGIQTELKSIDAGVFFSTDPGSPDTSKKFYADWEMYGGAAGSPDAQRFLNFYTTAQIPQKANNWAFSNDSRYANPAYDKLAEQARTELDSVKRTALLKAEYQLLYDDAAALPLISRKQAYAYASGLQGFEGNPWGALTWNIANWTKG